MTTFPTLGDDGTLAGAVIDSDDVEMVAGEVASATGGLVGDGTTAVASATGGLVVDGTT